MKILEDGIYEWEVGDYVTGKPHNCTVHCGSDMILGQVVEIRTVENGRKLVRVEVICHEIKSYIGNTYGVRDDRNALLPAPQSVIDQFVGHLEPVSPQLTFDAIL